MLHPAEEQVNCKTCGRSAGSLIDECEECRLDRLIKDAIDHHGWTKEMGESLKTRRGF